MVQERISCRANLVKKHILADPACALCGQPEDCDHLILHCRFAAQVWSALTADTIGVSVRCLWNIPRPTTVPSRHYSSFILLVCWLLWKSRNELVFQNITPSVGRFWLACRDEARLWSHHLKIEDRQIVDACPRHLLDGHGTDVGRSPGDGAHRRRHPRDAARRVGGPRDDFPCRGQRPPGALRDVESLVDAACRAAGHRRAEAKLVAEPEPTVQRRHARRRRRQQLLVPLVEGLRAPQRVLAPHEAPRQH
uniref:Reverse transcriptase zinc-binding domain-containing protein n=1 Tax=Setaria italica TaxID=4555 RepID=K3ZL79_SETIT